MRTESLQQLKRKNAKGARPFDTTGVLLDSSVATSPIDLAKIFGNTNPTEVEIGTGKGTFLIQQGRAREQINFLGIEYAKPYAIYSADRIRRASLANIRILHGEAEKFFRLCLTNCSLWRVHIYFPDPWPKRRHLRRRLITPSFINQIHRVLQIGGQLIIITDHQEYFRQICHAVNNIPGLASTTLPNNDSDDEVRTNFERKYLAQGRPLYSIAKMKYA